MAFYKSADAVRFFADPEDTRFDKPWSPGSRAEFSGIYRCWDCDEEAVTAMGHPLPPLDHHQHGPGRGPIQWRLLVATGSQPIPKKR